MDDHPSWALPSSDGDDDPFDAFRAELCALVPAPTRFACWIMARALCFGTHGMESVAKPRSDPPCTRVCSPSLAVDGVRSLSEGRAFVYGHGRTSSWRRVDSWKEFCETADEHGAMDDGVGRSGCVVLGGPRQRRGGLAAEGCAMCRRSVLVVGDETQAEWEHACSISTYSGAPPLDAGLPQELDEAKVPPHRHRGRFKGIRRETDRPPIVEERERDKDNDLRWDVIVHIRRGFTTKAWQMSPDERKRSFLRHAPRRPVHVAHVPPFIGGDPRSVESWMRIHERFVPLWDVCVYVNDGVVVRACKMFPGGESPSSSMCAGKVARPVSALVLNYPRERRRCKVAARGDLPDVSRAASELRERIASAVESAVRTVVDYANYGTVELHETASEGEREATVSMYARKFEEAMADVSLARLADDVMARCALKAD